MSKKRTYDLDAAELWLRDNDPHYASNSRKWRTPRTDALEVIASRSDTPNLMNIDAAVHDNHILSIPARPGGHGVPGVPAVVGAGHRHTKPPKDYDA